MAPLALSLMLGMLAAGPGVSPAVADWQPDERLSAAEAAIPGPVQVLSTQHFRFYLGATPPSEVRRTITALEDVWSFYSSTLASLVPLPDDRPRMTVFILDSPEGLDRALAALSVEPDRRRPGLAWNASPPFVALDHSSILGPGDMGVLFGAVVRVAHDLLLYDSGAEGSWWLREGMAIYVTQTRRDGEGRFEAGKVRTSEGYIEDITPRGRMASGLAHVEEPLKAIKALRRAYKRQEHVPLAELLAARGRGSWPDPARRETASVASWVLVHFLLHGEQGDLRPRPAAFLRHERRGEGGVDAFRRTVSRDIERFEEFLHAHTKRMK